MTLEGRVPASTDEVVRSEIVRRLTRIGAADTSAPPEHAVLAELGIQSLDLLELIDSLETVLGANPFEGRIALSDVRTVGDLYAAYRPDSQNAAAGDSLLEHSRRRAEARRRGRRP